MRRRLLRFCSVILMVVMVFSACPTYAANEQPSGTSYKYYDTLPSNVSTSSDYWSSSSRSLASISYQILRIYNYLSTLNSNLTTINSNLLSKFNYTFQYDSLGTTKSLSITSGSSLVEALLLGLSAVNYNVHQNASDLHFLRNYLSGDTGIKSINNNLSSIASSSTSINTLSSDILSSTSNIDSKLSSVYKSRFNFPYRSSISSPILSSSNYTPAILDYKFSGLDHFLNLETPTINSSLDFLSVINANLLQSAFLIRTYNTFYNYSLSKLSSSGTTTTVIRPSSLFDILISVLPNIHNDLSRLSFILADDDTIAAKQANKDQEQSVLTNFTGSGGAAASVSDFVGVKDGLSDFKSSLSGGAAASEVFDVFDSSSDGWSWFSSDTSNNLDNVQSGSNARRVKSRSSSTPLIDAYYADVMSHLGGNL